VYHYAAFAVSAESILGATLPPSHFADTGTLYSSAGLAVRLTVIQRFRIGEIDGLGRGREDEHGRKGRGNVDDRTEIRLEVAVQSR
jgi:hypothetical protein